MIHQQHAVRHPSTRVCEFVWLSEELGDFLRLLQAVRQIPATSTNVMVE